MTGADLWRLIINVSKTNVMHFRNKEKNRSVLSLKLVTKLLSMRQFIDILGYILMNLMDFTIIAETLQKREVEL